MFATVMAWAAGQPAGSQAHALRDMILSGVLSTRLADGAMVQYRSVAEMERALTSLYQASIAAPLRRPGVTIARVGSGL
jgi:hypothetical protein